MVSCLGVGYLLGKYVVGLEEGEFVGSLVKSQRKEIGSKNKKTS
jgi:hypothetical protein